VITNVEEKARVRGQPMNGAVIDAGKNSAPTPAKGNATAGQRLT